LLFFVIVTLSGSSFLVFSLRLGNDWLAAQISRTYLSIIKQKSRFIEEEALRTQSLLDSAVHREEVLDILSKPLSPYEKHVRILDFRRDIVANASYNEVEDIYFYQDETLHFYLHDIIFRYHSNFGATQWYRQTAATPPDRVKWFGLLPSQFNETAYQLYLSKPVVTMKRGELHELGQAFMTVDKEVFNRILADLNDSGTTCVVAEGNHIVYCSDPAPAAYPFDMSMLRRSPTDSTYVVTGTPSARFITVVGSPNQLGWRIVHRARFDGYPPEVRFTRRLLGSLFVLSALMFAAFLLVYRYRIGIPLRQLAQSVFSYRAYSGEQRSAFGSDPATDPKDLNERVREIVEETKTYVARLNHSERQRQIAEVRKLQAQMNPHFLYKILNNIRFIAMLNDQSQIVEITDELFSLVVASLTDTDLVTLSQECTMLEAYAKLVQSIYENRVAVEIHMHDDALDCYVPKLLLQPIVENALYHGLDPNTPGGLIQVSGRVDGQALVLSVADNGHGLRESPLPARPDHERRDRAHIGLVGTDKRLQVFFGVDYSVRLGRSTLGGAEVLLRFPAERTPRVPAMR